MNRHSILFPLWASLLGLAIAAPQPPAPTASAVQTFGKCQWTHENLMDDSGKARSVNVCRDAHTTVLMIASDSYPGYPNIPSLAAMLGFKSNDCSESYHARKSSMQYVCQNDQTGFLLNITGSGAAQSIHGQRLGYYSFVAE